MSQAQGCAILYSKLLVTSVGPAPTQEVHRDVLMVLEDAFKEGAFTEFIPELVTTSYLGPDIDAATLSAEASSDAIDAGYGGSHQALAIIFSASCIALVVAYIALPAATPRAVVDKAVAYLRLKRHKPLPTCSGPASQEVMVDDGALVPYSGSAEGGLDDALVPYADRAEEDIKKEYGLAGDTQNLLR